MRALNWQLGRYQKHQQYHYRRYHTIWVMIILWTFFLLHMPELYEVLQAHTEQARFCFHLLIKATACKQSLEHCCYMYTCTQLRGTSIITLHVHHNADKIDMAQVFGADIGAET